MLKNADCKVVVREGVAGVFNESGTPSALYGQLLDYYGNQDQAMDAWSVVYTKEYAELVGKTDSGSSLTDVLRFLTENPSVNKSVLSARELNEVLQIMQISGIGSLDVFTKQMNRLFKPNGVFEVDADRLFKSGWYSMEEIDRLDLVAVKDFLEKLDNTNLHTEVYAVPSRPAARLKNSAGEKTIIGTYKTVSEDDVVEYIVRNSPSLATQQIDAVLDNSEFSGITDKALRRRLYNRAIPLRKIPKVYFDGERITQENLNTYTTLKNGLMLNVDPIELQADIEVLEDISPSVWDSNKDTVERVLKGIEKSVVKYNLDLAGLSKLSKRENVLQLLTSAANMVAIPSKENILSFSLMKDSLLVPEENSVVLPVPEKYGGYNIFYFESDMTPDDVFSLSGMLKIGDNMYHSVSVDTTEAYDYLYEQYRNGILGIPKGYIAGDSEEEVRSGIRNFINTRDVGFPTVNQEQISLAQVVFSHSPLPIYRSPYPTENWERLRTGFVGEFYRFKLEEKVKASDLYDKILKHFSLGDGDLNFNGLTLPDITGMRFESDLREYAAIKKEGKIKDFAIPRVDVSEDIEAVNYPRRIKELPSGSFIVHDTENIVAKNVGDLYVNIEGGLFRKVVENIGGNALFRKVNILADNLYFDANTNFETDTTEAAAILEAYSGSIQSPAEYKAGNIAQNIKSVLPTPFTLQMAVENSVEVEKTYDSSQEEKIRNIYDNCGTQ